MKFKVGDTVECMPGYQYGTVAQPPSDSGSRFYKVALERGGWNIFEEEEMTLIKESYYQISAELPGMKNEPIQTSINQKGNMSTGTKHDADKPDMSLLSSVAITEVAKVMTFGKKKYDAHNWRKGIVYSRLIAAALRHIFAWTAGEDKDLESGLSHLAHAACCLQFLIEFEVTKPELDDRYKKGSK